MRLANFDDYGDIAQLHANSWRRHYRGILSDQYLDHDVDAERLNVWQKRMESPANNQYVILATVAEEIVGFCCFYLDDDPAFGTLIDNFHVSADFQRAGIGKTLFSHSATIICKEATSPKVYLWVFELNKKARAVYERLGGQLFETVDHTNEDGTQSKVCRYIWPDAATLL